MCAAQVQNQLSALIALAATLWCVLASLMTALQEHSMQETLKAF